MSNEVGDVKNEVQYPEFKPKRRGRPPYKHLNKTEEERVKVNLKKKDGSSLTDNDKKLEVHIEGIINSKEVKNKFAEQEEEALLSGEYSVAGVNLENIKHIYQKVVRDEIFKEFISIFNVFYFVMDKDIGYKAPIVGIEVNKFVEFCKKHDIEYNSNIKLG